MVTISQQIRTINEFKQFSKQGKVKMLCVRI